MTKERAKEGVMKVLDSKPGAVALSSLISLAVVMANDHYGRKQDNAVQVELHRAINTRLENIEKVADERKAWMVKLSEASTETAKTVVGIKATQDMTLDLVRDLRGRIDQRNQPGG